jgi:hypothetical protein
MWGRLSPFAALVNLSLCVRPGAQAAGPRHRSGFSIDFTKFASAVNGAAMDDAIDPLTRLAIRQGTDKNADLSRIVSATTGDALAS